MKKNLLTLLLLSFIALSSAFAQNRTITGTVTGEDDGAPLPGVSVKIKGTSLGTQTSMDGKFSLVVTQANKALIFSFLGYSTKEVLLTTSNSIKVSLKLDSKALSEVVVTSFGIERSKKSMGYSSQTVTADELQEGRNLNVTNSLQAKVAGVQVNGSGGAFTGSSVIIRGFTTFTGSNQPIYVVDGIPVDNGGGGAALQTGPSVSNRGIDINEDDVETVTVLKGAAATVLYGSRASSGAVVITTRKGSKAQKTRVDFTSTYGANTIDRLPKYQNDYAQGNNGAFGTVASPFLYLGSLSGGVAGANTSWGPKIAGQTVTNYFGTSETIKAYPNNISDFFKTGTSLQNNVGFSGGNDKTNYRVSYGNDYETFVISNNTLRRNNVSVNARTEVSPRLRVGTSFTYVNNQSTRTLAGNELSNPLFRGWFVPRSYDLTGLPYQDAVGNEQYFGAEDSPYWSINHNLYHDNINRVFGSVNATYDLTSWLTADLKVGTDYYNTKSNGYDEIGNRGGGFTGASGTGVGGIIEAQSNFRSIEEFFTLSGSRKFGKFNITGTIGNEINQVSTDNSQTIGYTLVVPNFDNLKNTLTYVPTYSTSMTRTIGVFADFVIDYNHYLTLNIKGRNDFPSTLLSEDRSTFYPAVAASYILTDAFPALKSKVISQIKLRGSIGKVGRSPGAYNTDSYYVRASAGDGFGPAISFPYQSPNGSLAGYTLSNAAGNPALKPEFTTEYELGGEFGFFQNRLTIDGTVYKRNSTNILLAVPVAPSSGVTSLFQNAGSLSTRGIELLIGGTPIKTKDFSYNISINFTSFKSTVVALAPGVSIITLAGFTTPNVRLVAGQEYGQIYGSDYQRDANNNILINPTTGLPLGATTDVKNIGNPNPKWTGGITNTFNYKGFSLSVLLDFRHGGEQYARNIADIERTGAAAETAEFPRFEADGVTYTKPYVFPGVYASGANAGSANTTPITAQDYWGTSGKFVAAKAYIFDTSWFRIREASLNYSIPSSFLTKTPFGKASIGVYGRNLLLSAPNYPHFDPEQNALGISNAQGLEFNAYPNARTIGVNLKFTL